MSTPILSGTDQCRPCLPTLSASSAEGPESAFLGAAQCPAIRLAPPSPSSGRKEHVWSTPQHRGAAFDATLWFANLGRTLNAWFCRTVACDIRAGG